MKNIKETRLLNQPEPRIGQKSLSKIEGILTSSIQLKQLKNKAYYLAFFQLEGLEQDIPVIFKLATPCLDCENAKTICQALIKHSKSKCEECREPHTEDCLEENKPNIPPKAKLLLEGHWADMSMRQPNNSTRPSFTCLAWEIIANPPPLTIKSLREQISSLLTTSLEKQTEWKQRVDYLFQRLNYLKDLDQLSKLGSKYLQAYLLLKSASYANYQDNLLPHTTDLTNYDQYLTKLQSEIEEIAQNIRAYQSKEI